MSMSLRDQLIQAGLVTEKQARQSEQQQRQQQRQQPQQSRKKPAPTPEQTLAAERAQAAKAARDQELNRQQREKADRKAKAAQIKQLIEQNRLPRIESEDYFNFIDRGKIKRMSVDNAMRGRLMSGDVAIVRFEGRFDFVPAETAARIRERDERAVMAFSGSAGEVAAADADDPYKDHKVPDDLMW